MAVTLDHLRGDVHWREVKILACQKFHLGVQVRIVAHRAGKLSHRHFGDRVGELLMLRLVSSYHRANFRPKDVGSAECHANVPCKACGGAPLL